MKVIRPRYTLSVYIYFTSSPPALGNALDGGKANYAVLVAVYCATKTSVTTKRTYTEM